MTCMICCSGWRIALAGLVAACCLLLSCNDNDSAEQPAAQITPQQSAQTTPAPAQSATKPAQITPVPAADSTEPTGAAEPEPAQAEAAGSDREDPVERPEPRPLRPGDIVSIETKFRRAELVDPQDAKLSQLFFEFRSNLGRMKNETVEVVMNGSEDEASGELDMGLCLVRIFPVITRMYDQTAIGSGRSRYRADGSFQLRVYAPEGELMGVFGVNAGGEFMSAPPESSPEGYGIRARRRTGDYGPVPYTIYRRSELDGTTEYLVTVQYSEGTFDADSVTDANANEFEFRFPNGLIEFHTPQIKQRGDDPG